MLCMCKMLTTRIICQMCNFTHVVLFILTIKGAVGKI